MQLVLSQIGKKKFDYDYFLVEDFHVDDFNCPTFAYLLSSSNSYGNRP